MSDVALGPATAATRAPGTFRHEAFLYAGTAGFLEGTVPFVEAGLAAGEPVLVVVAPEKIEHLRDALGPHADRVAFADMGQVGRNPARIIPAWGDFLAAHGGGRPARGIGEPVFAGRTADEVVECQRHEALLNVAFAGGAPWRLLCPYDTTALRADVLDGTRHSHRFLTGGGRSEENLEYEGDTWPGPAGDDLPPPPGAPPLLTFDSGPLEPVREFVTAHAAGALGPAELSDLLLALTEVASNSVLHGGGAGTVRVWTAATAVVCEVRDRGWIRQPLVGRTRPQPDQENGRGLWMVNQLCDLVQLRSSPAGTRIRLHVHRRSAG